MASSKHWPIDTDFLYRFSIIANLYSLYYAEICVKSAHIQMIGKCDQCGMSGVEVKMIKGENEGKTRTLCNQCRPADGAYAY